MYYQENGSFPVSNETVTTATVGTASAAGGLFNSIGLATMPNIPKEVSSLVVTGTATTATLAMTLAATKATVIDGKVVTLTGTAGPTAITWACTASTSALDPIAVKYFGCP